VRIIIAKQLSQQVMHMGSSMISGREETIRPCTEMSDGFRIITIQAINISAVVKTSISTVVANLNINTSVVACFSSDVS